MSNHYINGVSIEIGYQYKWGEWGIKTNIAAAHGSILTLRKALARLHSGWYRKQFYFYAGQQYRVCVCVFVFNLIVKSIKFGTIPIIVSPTPAQNAADVGLS